MIHKVKPIADTRWDGIGKPKKGAELIMYNPVFGNSDYTRYYKDKPSNTVYVVVREYGNHIIRPIDKVGQECPFEKFSCSKGFDKHFMPHNTNTKCALKGLTIDM